MLIVKKTGLVPVRSAKRGGRAGIYGLPPTAARVAFLAGEVVFLGIAEIPDDIHVDVVGDPTPKKKDEGKPEEVVLVEIPAEWVFDEEKKTFRDGNGEVVHPLKRIKVAQEITGVKIEVTAEDEAADIGKTDKADAIILAEIQKRIYRVQSGKNWAHLKS
ncbi:MAG: hypothetical protein ACYCZ0_00180 [Minisyncoccota bacterium]